MRASLDHFYVRQLSSLNPPTPEANRLLRRSGTHLPWHTWQLPRRLECKAVLEICALVIQTIIRIICSLGFAYVFPVCWLCVGCVLVVYLVASSIQTDTRAVLLAFFVISLSRPSRPSRAVASRLGSDPSSALLRQRRWAVGGRRKTRIQCRTCSI
jgi:hypothetical protein